MPVKASWSGIINSGFIKEKENEKFIYISFNSYWFVHLGSG